MPTIDDYKSAWEEAYQAGDQAGMDAAHAGAESIRAESGYFGGASGDEHITLQDVQNSVGREIYNINNPSSGGTSNLGYTPPKNVTPSQSREPLIKQQNDAALQAKLADIRNAIARVKSTYSTQRTSDLNTVQQTRNNINTSANNAIGTIQGQINSLSPQYDALKARANQNYQSGVQTQQGLINRASETYRPLLNQVSAGKAQLTREALERAANSGDNGGVGRQQQLQISTAAENDINKLSTDKQNYVNDANAKINDLANAYKVSIANLDAGQQSALNELSGKIANIESDRSTNLTNADLQVQAIEQKYSQAIAEAERSGSAEEVVANETARAAEIAAIRNEWDRIDKAAAQASKDALDEASQILSNKINSAKLEEMTNPDSATNKLAAAQAAEAQANLENLPSKFAQESQLNQAQIKALQDKASNTSNKDESSKAKEIIKNATDFITKFYTTKDPDGKVVLDREKALEYIKSLEMNGVPEPVIDQILTGFGMPLGK